MHLFCILIQYIGIIILMAEAFYIISHKPSRQQQYLTFLILALCINFFGYLLELQAPTQAESMVAVKFSYLGKPSVFICHADLRDQTLPQTDRRTVLYAHDDCISSAYLRQTYSFL